MFRSTPYGHRANAIRSALYFLPMADAGPGVFPAGGVAGIVGKPGPNDTLGGIVLLGEHSITEAKKISAQSKEMRNQVRRTAVQNSMRR